VRTEFRDPGTGHPAQPVRCPPRDRPRKEEVRDGAPGGGSGAGRLSEEQVKIDGAPQAGVVVVDRAPLDKLAGLAG
jgi:hypothetical protein